MLASRLRANSCGAEARRPRASADAPLPTPSFLEATMTRPSARARTGVALATVSILLALPPGEAAGQAVPTDPANSGPCSMSPAAVAAMFVGNSVTLDGVAKAADSTQVLAPNCGFFDWSEQMFLWLTSPAPAAYGGGNRIMFSPKFFT